MRTYVGALLCCLGKGVVSGWSRLVVLVKLKLKPVVEVVTEGRLTLLVEEFSTRGRGQFQGVVMQALICHKDTAQGFWIKWPHWRAFLAFCCVFLAGSLWHKRAGTRNIMNLSTNESQALLHLDQWEWRTLPGWRSHWCTGCWLRAGCSSPGWPSPPQCNHSQHSSLSAPALSCPEFFTLLLPN